MLSDIFVDYSWYIALAHFALAVTLTFIVNWIGARAISVGYMQMDIVIQEDTAPAFNFLFKVLAPVVFLVLCAVAFEAANLSSFNSNIYFITIFYWLFRVLWILCSNRGSLTNWVEQFIYWVASIGLSVWIYSLIESVDQILPSSRSLLDQLWILIIVFVYSILNKVQISREGTIRRKTNYINSRFLSFRKKYDGTIKEFFHNDFYEALTYSIMIYEDFNRPVIVRYAEYLSFCITRKPHSLGIMQMTTDKYIDNKESIRLAMQKIVADSDKAWMAMSKNTFIESIISSSYVASQIGHYYNPGDYNYASEIREIFNQISKSFYGPMPNSLEDFEKIFKVE
jgi:hypothetical protein